MRQYDGRPLLSLRDTLVVREETRKTMQANRATETTPEIALRKALWAAGLRGYRKNAKRLPGKPDIVFGQKKLAIFVHGCFWHGCIKCARRYRTPKTNTAYWTAKVESNQARDERNQAALRDLGYRVLVLWECDVKKGVLGEAVERIRAELG